jgi:mannose-6-phosphate isomerase-like protein (cupin superfamily)
LNGYSTSIEEETRKNSDFRRVLYTGKYSQLVLMNLKPSEGIGLETHTDRDQSSSDSRKGKAKFTIR